MDSMDFSDADFLVVGCGGIGFHAQSLLSVGLPQSIDSQLILADPDRIETGNWKRQWANMGPGLPKVVALASAIGYGTRDVGGLAAPEGVSAPDTFTTAVDRPKLVLYRREVTEDSLDLLDELGEEARVPLVVFGWTDSSRSRLVLLRLMKQYCEEVNPRRYVLVVFAGNDAEGAMAFGTSMCGNLVVWPMGQGLRYLQEGAEGREVQPGTEVEGKAAEEEGRDCDAQTALQNHMAAQLSFHVLDLMWQYTFYGFGVPVMLMWEAERNMGYAHEIRGIGARDDEAKD